MKAADLVGLPAAELGGRSMDVGIPVPVILEWLIGSLVSLTVPLFSPM